MVYTITKLEINSQEVSILTKKDLTEFITTLTETDTKVILTAMDSSMAPELITGKKVINTKVAGKTTNKMVMAYTITPTEAYGLKVNGITGIQLDNPKNVF